MSQASSSRSAVSEAIDEIVCLQQLRIKQICSILVRNLTLRPNRDRALRSLADPGAQGRSHANTTADDADLALRIGRSNSTNRSRAKAIRRRSSSWHRESEDHAHQQADSASSERRKARLSSGPESSLRSRDSDDADSRLSHTAPRPILKAPTGNTGRDPSSFSYFSDLSPSASSSFPFGEMGASLLSRSDSHSSSRSSSTLMRRPGGRTRTASATSTISVRSVRFEEQGGIPSLIRRPSTPGANRSGIGNASRFLVNDRPLNVVIDERLLECCVDLYDVAPERQPVMLKDGSLGPAPFYETQSSRGGLHHTWGFLRGAPLCPETDFCFPTGSDSALPESVQEGLAGSQLGIRIWAKRQFAAASSVEPEPSSWKLVSATEVDLRELQKLEGDLLDPRLSIAPNTLILGLSTSSSSPSDKLLREKPSLSPRPDSDPAEIAAQLAGKGSESQKQAARTRRVLEQVSYYVVPLDGSTGRSNRSVNPRVRSPLSASLWKGSETPADGVASDPESPRAEVRGPQGSLASTTPLQGKQRRSLFKTEERAALERSLRETRMMPSYSLSEAKELLDKQLELSSLTTEAAIVRARLDSALGDDQGQINLQLRRNQAQERLLWLRSQRDQECRDANEREEELERRRSELDQRRRKLKLAQLALGEEKQAGARLVSLNERLRKRVERLSLRVHQRQARLLRALEEIFPIDLIDGSALLFSIAGIPLPNAVSSCPHTELEAQDKALKALVKAQNRSEEGDAAQKWIYHALDDDTISTALGLVAQLVILLSAYLSTPVHYPMATAGSRAVVQDSISIMSGPRAFPLYAKGVERYRYEYAAFLLNKNIEQLMNVHNVTVLDIRHTLPNLKNLIVTVSAAPPASYSTRKRHVGQHEISLIAPVAASTSLHALTSNGEAVENSDDKKEAIVQLGLGRPWQATSTPPEQGAMAPGNGPSAVKQEALVTTRILGSTKAQPTTSGSAIESITKALNFFGSRQS